MGDMQITDWNQFVSAVHPSQVHVQRIPRKEVKPVYLVDNTPAFPVKEGRLIPTYPLYLNVDEENVYK